MSKRVFRVTLGLEEDRHGKALGDHVYGTYLGPIEKDAAKSFGGYTTHYGYGGWINYEGRLVRERIVTFTIYAYSSTSVKQFAFRSGKTLNQAAVAFEDCFGRAEILQVL